MPPGGTTNTRRQLTNLVATYNSNRKRFPIYSTLSNGLISISSSVGLSLTEFIQVLKHICSIKHHKAVKCDCSSMIQVAEIVLKEGIIKLPDLFRSVFPHVSYRSIHAKRRLL